jgi:ABC-type glycerol-3-phosphate transport system permease component
MMTANTYKQRRGVGFYIGRILAYALLIGFGFIIIFPFIYMMMTSFKSSTDVFRYPPKVLPYTQATVTYQGQELPAYSFTVDGRERTLVNTGERVQVASLTAPENINVDEPRQSKIDVAVPLEEARETGEIITLQDSSGADEEFPIYEVTVDGQTLTLPLAYRGAQNIFVDPNDESVRVVAAERTATKQEFVQFQTSNYNAFTSLNLNRALVNTALVTFCVVAGQLITSLFGGYAFSRIQFRGRDTLFLAYLGSIMIPFVVLIIPMYRLMVVLDWQNKLVSLILPWIFTAYGTFLMRQFFISIPKEIEEAAMLDGASRFRILWQLFVPLSTPAIATLAIFSFLYAWNSFLWPLISINQGNEMNHVMTLALIKLRNIAADRPNIVLTGAAIAILPPMIVFILAQRYFIEGISGSAVKG